MHFFTDNIIVKGGWVMAPIILGSVIAFALAIERGIVFWKIRFDVKKFAADVFSLLVKGDVNGALAMCDSTPHPIGAVFKTGLQNRDRETADIERIMEHEGNREVAGLEKNLSVLMVVIGIEPMLGFLGTIIGLIQAFMTWERFSSTVTVDQLAAGIYQAMITTAGGLLVAIPFYVVYSFFVARVGMISRDLNHYSEELLMLIREKKENW